MSYLKVALLLVLAAASTILTQWLLGRFDAQGVWNTVLVTVASYALYGAFRLADELEALQMRVNALTRRCYLPDTCASTTNDTEAGKMEEIARLERELKRKELEGRIKELGNEP